MRPVFLAVFFFAGLALQPLSFTAIAQTVPPAPVDEAGWGAWLPFVTLVRESVVAGALTLAGLVAAYFTPKLPNWLRIIFERKETEEANTWEAYVERATRRALSYAEKKIGPPKGLQSWEEKEGFVAFALGCLRHFNKDIVEFLDKDNNGVLDILEGARDDANKRPGAARFLDTALMEAGAPAHVFERPRETAPSGRQQRPRPAKPSQMDLEEDASAASMASKLRPRRV